MRSELLPVTVSDTSRHNWADRIAEPNLSLVQIRLELVSDQKFVVRLQYVS